MAWNPVANVKGPQGDQGAAGTTSWAGITDKPSTFTPSSHTHPANQISDSTTVGRAVVTAADAAAARSAIGAVAGAGLTLWTGTAAQYAAIGTKDANTVYVVTA